MANSFIENINTVANATKLATGNVVEDAQLARDEAETAASNANKSEINSLASENKANEWAVKGHNNPVEGTSGVDAQYSAYHWSVEASNIIGDPLIDDDSTSSSYTWSSSYIKDRLNEKSQTDHTHPLLYEPKFVKKTAFNKNFGGTSGNFGVADTLARTDHLHDYEPKRTTFGTAYNKDFGTAASTLAEGNHLHSDIYMPLASINTAYNKNFVIDSNSPLSTEIPRGNHIHKATGISFDNSTADTISSTTVQGAIGQLDSQLSVITISEKCKIVAGLTDPSYIVDIVTQDSPAVINAGLTILADVKNAVYSNGVKISYTDEPDKLIEGQLDVTMAVNVPAGAVYALTFVKNGTIISDKFIAEVTNSAGGITTVSLSGWISGLSQNDVISPALINTTDTTDITLHSMTVSFAGQPDGALIVSGTTIDHSDIIGKDAVLQHPTTSIYDAGSSTSLDLLLDKKTNVIDTPVENNLIAMDATGDAIDSGVQVSTLTGKSDKIDTPVLDNILIMESDGNLKDSGYAIADLALNGGDSLVEFSVATPTLDASATPKSYVDALASGYTTISTFDTHEGLANPHGTVASDIGAAEAVHVHAESDITGLTDRINGKYTKVASATTGYIPTFKADGELEDSGLNPSDFVLSSGIIDMLETEDIGTTVQGYDVSTTIQGNIFNGAEQLVKLDDLGKLPVLDGSNLSNLPSGFADPMTSVGDIIYKNSLNETTRLPIGTSGQVVSSNGTNVQWVTLDTATLGLENVDNTADLDKPVSTATQTAIDSVDKYIQAEVDAKDVLKADITYVDSEVATKANTVHTHVEADIADLDKYTQSEVDSSLETIKNNAIAMAIALG